MEKEQLDRANEIREELETIYLVSEGILHREGFQRISAYQIYEAIESASAPSRQRFVDICVKALETYIETQKENLENEFKEL